MPLAPRAILFDLDGVLVSSEEAWFLAVEEAGRRFRGQPVTRKEFSATFGQGTAADVAQFGFGCTPKELDAFYTRTVPLFGARVRVDPEAEKLLSALGERGLKRALVTNTVGPLAESIVEAAGLSGRLEALSCAGMVPLAKPAPDLLFLALDRLQVSAADAWMVGDSRYDREAARAAGVWFVGRGLEGDLRIDGLGELLVLLDAAVG